MADTEHISLVELGVSDAPAGPAAVDRSALEPERGRLAVFAEQGTVFGVRDGKQLVATAALLPYSSGNAWISMVLVTANWRRRGNCDAAGRRLPQRGDKTRPHRLARCDA